MGTEQNIDVISIENLRELLVHVINVHLWLKWKGLDEEHAVLELGNIRLVVLLPENLDWLGERLWDETAVWLNGDLDWC